MVEKSPESVSRRRTRVDSRRELILDAAAVEFAEVGYERATLDRIGKRVGLSKASLYYYVKGKEDLFAQAVERFVDDVMERVDRVETSDPDPLGRFTALVHAHLDVGTTTAHGRMLAENLHALRHERAAVHARRYEAIVARVLEDAVVAGALRRTVTRPTVKMILGVLNAVSLWFDPDGNMSLDEVAVGVVALLLSGLTAPDHLRRS